MNRNETILPLTLGLIFALAIHLGGAAGLGVIQRYDATLELKKPDAPKKPLPDLTVTAMVVSEPRVPGKAVNVKAAVSNIGQLPVSRFAVALTVDDEPIAELTLGTPLAPGASVEQTFQYTAAKGGLHRLRVAADPANAVEESDETNNALEQTLVWKSPGVSQAARPDLAVYSLDVGQPRIAGDPSRVTVGLANLGGDLRQPFEVQLAVDGQPAQTITITEPIPSGSLTALTGTIRVTTVGEHEVKATADPARRTDDSDRANNALARRFTWLDPADQDLKIGQKDPSPVEINWISWDDFEKLQARQSKFDQAALQRTAERTPDAKQMPIDPTPPAATRPEVASKPSPPVKQQVAAQTTTPTQAQPQEQPQAPRMIAKADPEPKPPAQTAKPTDAKVKEATDAPPLPKADAKTAAAPLQQPEPKAPTKIEPRGKTDQTQTLVDSTPAPKPVPAPPPKTAPGKEVALATPPVPSNSAAKAQMPESIAGTRPDDLAQRRAPQTIAPDPRSNPDDKSRTVDAPENPPMLAALPLTPRLADPPGSPQKDKPLTPPTTKQQAPDKPADPAMKPADGQQPSPPVEQVQPVAPQPQQQPTPPSPEPTPPSSARPTPAPKTVREADPVSLIQGLEVHPGKVVARQGLQINTVKPRFAPVAQLSSAPNNPDVIVVFNKAGEVTKAEVLRSTGYANIDGPILASLYKWTAEGDLIKKVPSTLTIQVHILLTPED